MIVQIRLRVATRTAAFRALAVVIWAGLSGGRTDAALAQAGVLSGVVLDSVTGRPVDRAKVSIGEAAMSQTDARGKFRLKGLGASSTVELWVRKIGYFPSAVVKVVDSAPRIDTLRLVPIALTLDSVSIQAVLTGRNPALAEFYRRRSVGVGRFFTRQEIWSRNPTSAESLIRSSTGLAVICSRGSCSAASSRPTAGRTTCPLDLFVDGQLTTLTIDQIPVGSISGVEIYSSAASTPPQYQRGWCGALIIWTGADDY